MIPPQTPPNLVTLVLLTALSTLSLNMFLPSLPTIAEDLGAEYGTVSLAIGGYLAVTAVVQLIVGPMSDRIGRRPVLLGALVAFVAASLACAQATDIRTFLVCRVAQGGIIAGYTLSLAIVRDTRGERAAAGLLGYISMAMALAPMLGPMLGGGLDTLLGWRASFYAYALFGMVLFALCWIDLGETKPARTPDRFGAARGLSPLLTAPLFWAYALCSAASTGAFYIFLTGAPLVAQIEFGVSTAELGVFIGSITVGFLAGSFLAGRLAPKVDPIAMMLAGRVIACLGLTSGIVALAFGPRSPALFFGSTIFVGLGNGITMPSANAGALSVRPDLAGSAAGVSGALTVAGGALLTTLTGIVLPPEDPALTLLSLMLAASGAGLAAVLLARRLARAPAR